MHRINSGRARNCHIDKYIGSDFDKVVIVADNIEAIKDSANIGSDISKVSSNMDDINKVADNLDNYEISESQVLQQGQVIVNLTNLVAKASDFYVMGQLVDGDKLTQNIDYTVTGDKQITLVRSYPYQTTIEAIQKVRADDTLISKQEYTDLLNRVITLENK